ncbi:hypothetical protein PV325_005021 [Microctonus aethiopoides]|nr:hypothetical protein PV325_005021 [Microctonus aethiopoides]
MMYIIKKTLIFIGIITIIRDSIITSVIAAPSNNSQRIICKKPIFSELYYNTFVQLIGDISVKEYNKTSTVYVSTYSNYAQSFEKFNERYPFFTIYTNGAAVSYDTFGDVGKNKFGKLYFATKNFIAEKDVYYLDFVDAFDKKVDEYEVKVKISLGFKRHHDFLFLIPRISGKLENFDQEPRSLQFGFALGRIEFNHKECY